MKLSMTQTILGVLIIITACFILAWMIFWTSPVERIPLNGGAGPGKSIEAHPQHETTYTVARYASGALLCLGIIVVFTSNRQAVNRAKRPVILASIQFSAGILAAATAAFITARGYPLYFVTPLQPESNTIGVLNINPGPGEAFLMLITTLTVLLGLAVAGIGIAQIIKSKKKAAS
jgi:Na+/proline symporter